MKGESRVASPPRRRYAPDPADLGRRKVAAVISLVVGLLLLGVKLVAWRLTGSSAVLSDALESVVHTFAIAFAVWSIFLAATPEDESHPYGHGKVEFFSAGIEGLFIVAAAIAITVDGVSALLEGRRPQELTAGVLLTLFSAVATLILGSWLVATGKRTRSVTLVADGHHILTDSLTSFAVVGGLLLVQVTGQPAFDPLVAIAVAVNIAVTGARLIRQSIGGLMDEADPAVLDQLAAALDHARTQACIDLHRLRAWKAGDTLHVDAHLTVPRFYSIEQAHDVMAELERAVTRDLDRRVHLLLHLDPCTPDFCAACEMTACQVRMAAFTRRIPWQTTSVVAERSPGQ